MSDGATELVPVMVIDRLAVDAERAPHAPLLPRSRLTNAEAWAQSGAVASWLIAQGFGPGAPSLALSAPDGPERIVLLLGTLRAGSLVAGEPGQAALSFALRDGQLASSTGIAVAALARCSIDAAVAERRLHIDADTPARWIAGTCRRHGDFVTIAQAIADQG
jgi:feruloyl-CoA synthase